MSRRRAVVGLHRGTSGTGCPAALAQRASIALPQLRELNPLLPVIEVTRSYATGAVTNYISGGCSAWVGTCQTSLLADRRFLFALPLQVERSIPSLRHRRFLCSREESCAAQRCSVLRENCVRSRTALARSIRALRHWSSFPCRHEGTIAMRIGSCQDEVTASFTTHGREGKLI